MSSVYLVPARSPCWSVLAGTHHTAAWQQWGWAAPCRGGEAQLPMTVAGHDVSRVSSAVPPESNSTGEERGSMSELSNAAVRYVTAFTGGMVHALACINKVVNDGPYEPEWASLSFRQLDNGCRLNWSGFCSAFIVRRLVSPGLYSTRFRPARVSCSPGWRGGVSSSTMRPIGTSPAPGRPRPGTTCAARRSSAFSARRRLSSAIASCADCSDCSAADASDWFRQRRSVSDETPGSLATSAIAFVSDEYEGRDSVNSLTAFALNSSVYLVPLDMIPSSPIELGEMRNKNQAISVGDGGVTCVVLIGGRCVIRLVDYHGEQVVL